MLKATTAKALGLTILESFLLRADDIEPEAASYLEPATVGSGPFHHLDQRGAHNHLVLFD
jgi:hypothetical protein